MSDFYYSTLNKVEAIIYDGLVEALKRNDDKAKVHIFRNPTSEEIQNTYLKFIYSNPSAFNYGTSYRYSASNGTYIFDLQKLYNLRTYSEYRDKIDRLLPKEFANAKRMNDDYDKIKFVHDYLAEKVTYSMASQEDFNVVGPLLLGHGACQGISLSVKLICDYIGIECIVLYGELNNGQGIERHAWNVVKINGVYYHLDVTCDLKSTNGLVVYYYFLINDSDVFINHKLGISFPIRCSSMKDNYYCRNRAFFSDVREAGKYLASELAYKNSVSVRITKFTADDYSNEIFQEATKYGFHGSVKINKCLPFKIYTFIK